MKRLLILSLILISPALIALILVQLSFEWRVRRAYAVDVEPVAIPNDAASIARGRELVQVGLCATCHGSNLSGRVSINDPALGQIYAGNLTAGVGGAGRRYDDADWVRAIRHGIGPDGRSLLVTPAQFYYYLSDEDLGAIIAYIKSLPPVDRTLPGPRVAPLGRLFITVFNPRDWFPAEKINHHAARPPAPSRTASVDYGRYLARIGNCLVCHDAPDISAAPGAPLAAWAPDDFKQLMTAGVAPDGHRIDNTLMPWRAIGHNLSSDDLQALWLYLQALPGPNDGRSPLRP